MRTGFESFSEEQKNEYNEYVLGEDKQYGSDSSEFMSYYGESLEKIREGKHNYYSYSFEREAGSNLAALMLLAKGQSIDNVFGSQKTPEIAKMKLEAGNEMLQLLDVEGPKAANSEEYDFKNFEGRIARTQYNPGEYYVGRQVAKNFMSILPSLSKEMVDLMNKVDLTSPRPFDTPEGKKLLRMSTFCFDIHQEMIRTDTVQLALEDEIKAYNEKKGPNEAELSLNKVISFIDFAGIAKMRSYYDASVKEALGKGLSDNSLSTVATAAASFKGYLSFFEDNKNKPGIDAFSLVPYPEARGKAALTTVNAIRATGELYPKISEYFGYENLQGTLTSGKFIKEFSAPIGTDKCCMLGYEYDAKKGSIRTPEEGKTEMQIRFDQASSIADYKNETAAYRLSTGEHFKALTGMTKEEFLNNTVNFGYDLAGSLVPAIITCELLRQGLTMDEIMDAGAKREEKASTVSHVKSLIEDHGYKVNSYSYNEQCDSFENFVVNAYNAAYPTLLEAVNRANANQNYFDKPCTINSTKQGSIDAVLLSIAREFDTDAFIKAAGKKNLSLPDRIKDLSKETSRFNTYYELDKAAVEAVTKDSTSAAIDLVIKAKMSQQSSDIQNKACEFYKNNLLPFIELNCSKKEISEKIANGSLLREMEIQIADNEIQSIAIMGVRYEKGVGLSYTDDKQMSRKVEFEVRDRYLEEVRRLTKELKETDALYLKFKNTKSFSDTRDKLYQFVDECSENSISFSELQSELTKISQLAAGYKDTHQGEDLSERQVKRLNIMKQLIRLSENAMIYEKNPVSVEAKSNACKELKETRFILEQTKLPENPSGIDILNERTKIAYRNIYNLLAFGREVTSEQSKSMIRDLKTAILHRFVDVECKQLKKKGLITNTVIKNAGKFEQLIDMMDIEGFDKIKALKNPTRENIEKMFGEKQVDQIIEKLVGDVKDKMGAAEALEKQNKDHNKEHFAKEIDNKNVNINRLP